jgi:hypothetical protein
MEREKSSHEWYTPPDLVKILAGPKGKFDFDPCAPQRKHWTAERCLTVKEDGLKTDWPEEAYVFCNPPYDFVLPWAYKMMNHAALNAGSGIMLVNASTDSEWFNIAVGCAELVYFYGKRVKFVDLKQREAGPNSKPTVFLVFGAWAVDVVLRAHYEGKLVGFPLFKRSDEKIIEEFFPNEPDMLKYAGWNAEEDMPQEIDWDAVEQQDGVDQFLGNMKQAIDESAARMMRKKKPR